MNINIPTQIKDISAFQQLRKTDRQIIATAVLMGLPNQDAFRLWHPEYIDGRGGLTETGKTASRQFWGYGKVKDYRERYEAELAEFLEGGNEEGKSKAGDIDEERKDNAVKALLNSVMTLVERGIDLDADTIKTIVDVFKKAGLLKDEVDQTEAPRRYLPETCNLCRFKNFVEEHIKAGDIEEYEEDLNIDDNGKDTQIH